MQRKIVVALWLIGVSFAFLTSCSTKSNHTVGLLLHEMEGRWYSDTKSLQKYAEQSGLELIIKIAEGDENKQLNQTQELIDEGAGVIIVVAVNQNTAAGIVRLAKANRIKTIAYDRIIQNADLDYFLSYDYTEIGQLQANYAVNKVPAGNYVILWGDASDNNARQMREGQDAFLESYTETGAINIVYRGFIENWAADDAHRMMKKVNDFSSPKIDVVLASNDNIALGVIEAFKDEHIELPKVITGQDATEESCMSILNNDQTMTIYKSNDEMARKAILLASNILNGKKPDEINGSVNNHRKDIPTIFLSPNLVDSKNVHQIMIQKKEVDVNTFADSRLNEK